MVSQSDKAGTPLNGSNTTLAIHVNEQLAFQLNADGTVIKGDGFKEPEIGIQICRALSFQYPLWLGDTVAHWVSNEPLKENDLILLRMLVGPNQPTVDLYQRVHAGLMANLATRAYAQAREAATEAAKRNAPPPVVVAQAVPNNTKVRRVPKRK